MSHPNKRESLLTQLENMHKQVSDETKRKMNESGSSSASANNKRNQPLFSNVLSRSERTNSMPMFAGSSSHNGLLTSNNSQDMNFVMGLSENLLVECRRLQADNERKARKFKTIKQSYEDLKESNQKLENSHQLAAKELQSLRDVNWGLEDKLQNLSIEFKAQKDKLSKNKRDLKHETESARKLKADLEVAELQRTNLENQLESKKKQLASEVADLKRHVSDLNDENDALHLKNHELNDQIGEFKKLKVMQPIEFDALNKEIKHARQTIRKLRRKVPEVHRQSRNSRQATEHEDSEEELSDTMDAGPDGGYMSDDLSFSDVEDYAKRHNMVILTNDALESIRTEELKTSDSRDQIVQAVEETNIVALPNDQASSKNPIQDSNIGNMIDLLTATGYEVIPEVNHKEIQDKLQAYLESKLADTGKLVIGSEEYDSIMNPPHAQIVEKLEKEGYRVLSESDHENLLDSLEHPTLKELETKLNSLNYVAISNDEFRSYKTPDRAMIETKAKSLGYTIVEDKTFDEMQKTVSNPPITFLKSTIEKSDKITEELLSWMSEKQNAVLLDKTKFNKLDSCYNHPTKEFLEEKAILQGYTLIQSTEYEELKKKLENPSSEYLEGKANAIQCKIVSSEEHANLVNLSEKPTIEFLINKAGAEGYCVVKVDDYETLSSTIKCPDVEFLSAKAKEKNYELVESEAYSSLLKNKSEPDLSYLKEKASFKGYSLVEKNCYEELLRKTLNPRRDEVASMAEKLGYVIVPSLDFERLRAISDNPSKQFLSEKAKRLNLLLISEKEKRELEEKGKDKASLLAAVKAFGFVPVPLPDLNHLKSSTIGKVGLPEIKTRLQALGYVAAPSEHYDFINKPVTDRATREETVALCSKYGLKPIAFEEYEKLKSNGERQLHSEDDCISVLKTRGYVLMTQDKHEDIKNQLESPGLDILKDHCDKLGHTIIPRNEYQHILNNLEKPSVDYLREKALILGFSLVDQKRLDELQHTFDSPSLKFLEQKAQFYGRELISSEEKTSKDKQIGHPSLSYLSDKAAEAGKCLIEEKILDELQRKIAAPTSDELEASCSGLGLTMLGKDEYSRLYEQANNPALRDLQRKLSKFGYQSLPRDEYDSLRENYNMPTEEYLSEKALSTGKMLIDKTVFERQQQQLKNPPQDFLAQHAANFNMKLVGEAEYEKDLALLASPPREYLEEKATVLDLVVIPQEELLSIKDQAESPSYEKMEKTLQTLGFVTIESAKYQALNEQAESPSVERISELARKHDCVLVYGKDVAREASDVIHNFNSMVESGSFVLLKRDAYDSLLHASVNKISKKEVIDICTAFNMVAIPCEKYEELTQIPDIETIQSLASRHASVVVLREQYDLLSAEADCPSKESMEKSAEQKGLKLVSRVEYVSLVSQVNSPTKRDVERQAEKLDLIAIPSEKYNNLLKEAKTKSGSATPSPSSKVLASKQYFEQVIRDQNDHSDKLYEPTKTLGFVKLSSEEYKRLKDNQQEHVLSKADIYNGAKTFSLAVLPLEEYRTLLKKKTSSNSMDYDNLEEYAARFDMKLVPLGLCDLESPTPRRRKSLESNKGEVLGFDDQSSYMTVESFSTQGSEYVDAAQSVNSLLRYPTVSTTTTSSQFTDALEDNINDDGSDAASVASTVRASNAEGHVDLEDVQIKASGLGYHLVANDVQAEQEVPELGENTVSSVGCSDSENDESELDEEDLKRRAEKMDLVLLPKSEYEEYQAFKNSPPTREKLELNATELGLVVITKNEYDDLLDKSNLDASRIQKLAAEFGLKALPNEHIKHIEDELANERLTKENIVAKARNLGFVAVTAERFEELTMKAESEESPVTREMIEQMAPSYGLIVTPRNDDQGKATPDSMGEMCSKEDLLTRGRSLGLAVLEQDEYQKLLDNTNSGEDHKHKKLLSELSVNDITDIASGFGLVLIDKDQFDQIKDELSHPTLKEEEIIEQALEHNMVCISKSEYDQLNGIPESRNAEELKTPGKVSQNSDAGSKKSPDVGQHTLAELKVIAYELGLFRAPENVLGSPSAVKPSVNEQVVVLPDYYFDELLSKERMLDLQEEDRSKVDALAATREVEGLQQPPSIGSPRFNIQKSRLGSMGYVARNDSLEAVHYKTYRKSKSSSHGSKPKAPLPVPKPSSPLPASKPSSPMHASIVGAKHSRNASLITRNDSIVSSMGRTGSMGAISLATVASLSEPSIIPALTQTVIGEYLYKYYPYLGQFGSNSRHERFFWIHPYTLTLYWSTSNPIMANPSSHKTKCAAILAVESIVDTNPYPAGLYHKSIIITSDKKTVKITCPTRQRHNIWYNSLRYLIQRNMEGINLEDIADDPSDTMYSGKIFPLPGENAKSTSQRLSSSRRSMRFKVPKSASMPIRRK